MGRTKYELVASYFSSFWAGVMSLLFVPMYIHYIGIEAYGLIGFFGVLQAWLALLDFGISPALCREMSRYIGGEFGSKQARELINTTTVLYGLTAILILLIVLAASPLIGSLWLNPQTLSPEAVVQ